METECSYLPFKLLNPLVQRVQLLLLLLARSLCSTQALLKLLNLGRRNKKLEIEVRESVKSWNDTQRCLNFDIGLLSSPHLRRDSTSPNTNDLDQGYQYLFISYLLHLDPRESLLPSQSPHPRHRAP